jgi:predicted RNA-binding protein with PIN domain
MSDAFSKHLLVDGSNIMHAWPELRALLPRNREAARSRLSQAVAALHDLEHIRVTVVFDGRGEELSFDQPSGQATFSHVHTPTGTTADEVIIQLVRQARVPGDCVVATDDRGEREAIEALGAAAVAAADLAGWVQRAAQRQRAQLRDRRADNEKKWRRTGGPD